MAEAIRLRDYDVTSPPHMLPETFREPLREHLERVRILFNPNPAIELKLLP